MGNSQINECIQGILDFRMNGISKEGSPGQGILAKYKYNTAYRLSRYIHKYRVGQITKDDLLVSLRNYLLVFRTTIVLPDDIDITDNKYGLRTDYEGQCSAVLDFPDFLQEHIVSQGFMRNYIESFLYTLNRSRD